MLDIRREEEEFQIVRLTTMARNVELKHVLSGEEVLQLQEIVRKVPVADHVIRYALQFSRLTRRTEGGCPDFINEFVSWGAGPRASQYLILAGKARALLERAISRQHGGHPAGGVAGDAAPDRHEFQRRGRRGEERRDREKASGAHPAAAVRGAGPDRGAR